MEGFDGSALHQPFSCLLAKKPPPFLCPYPQPTHTSHTLHVHYTHTTCTLDVMLHQLCTDLTPSRRQGAVDVEVICKRGEPFNMETEHGRGL